MNAARAGTILGIPVTAMVMPELPDVTLYVESMRERMAGHHVRRLRIQHPFVLRSVKPPAAALTGRRVTDVQRLGKRIVIALDDELFAVIHLMIAGRLWWRRAGAAVAGGKGLAAFDFEHGSLVLSEAGRRKRASLHLVEGTAGLVPFDRGGLEIARADKAAFMSALTRENHTLKRALTDPRVLSGIGNAYSDEILFAARLSPFKQTRALSPEEGERLFRAAVETLASWTDRLRSELDGRFPEKVTAFREGMAVHGRYRLPCPACGAPVQRIVYAESESNYCAACQTGGRVLADRALSRLLKRNWPRTLDELEREP